MKFRYATDDMFKQMLVERMTQLELKFKESLDISKLLSMQEPPIPNVGELLSQQEEIRRQLDKSYSNVEELLKKEHGETTPAS